MLLLCCTHTPLRHPCSSASSHISAGSLLSGGILPSILLPSDIIDSDESTEQRTRILGDVWVLIWVSSKNEMKGGCDRKRGNSLRERSLSESDAFFGWFYGVSGEESYSPVERRASEARIRGFLLAEKLLISCGPSSRRGKGAAHAWMAYRLMYPS